MERRNSAQIKLKLLVNGIQDTPQLFNNLDDFKEEHYAYDNGNWGVEAQRSVPTEVLLPGNIVSKVHIRPDSPLYFMYDQNQLFICENNKILSPCKTLGRPNFWNYQTSEGIPAKRYASFYGLNCLNFNIFSGCQFFSVGKQCRFCSVEATQAKHHAVEIRKSPEALAEICRLAVKHDNVEWILITGGSCLDRDEELDRHLAVLNAIRYELPWNGLIHGNVSLMPPKDLGRLRELKDAGVEHPSFNLEVYPEERFKVICPGKAHYVGFEHIIKCYETLLTIYQPGEVWCNFVAGLAPLEATKEGFLRMASMGVVPGANIYHPEVGSILGNSIPSPNEEYILGLYRYAAELYHRFDMVPYFNASVLRNSLANEAYEGLFD